MGLNTKTIKDRIREEYLNIRNSIDPTYREEASVRICNEIIKSGEYKNADTILMYSAINSEVSLEPLFEKVLSDKKIAAFPKCYPDRVLKFFEVTGKDDFALGKYSISEPNEGCREITDFGKALCLIPALAAGLDGTRVGYGGGYYDKFLVSHKSIIRMCVCFDAQVSYKKLPSGMFDEKFSRLVTERRRVFL
ncbi:MAG: 5-formyltetrahydrofolate cyclo-ligase [Ruminococcaceae bacterium]|nr:5-formyltetrahydrofolate cyclo-ligase [Oscillospiraceae bacterium]